MKHKLIRVLCIASALVLTAGFLPDVQMLFPDSVLTASAEDSGTCGKNLIWTMENGVLTISGTGDMEKYSYRSAPWYAYRNEMKQVVIAEGVTCIGDLAFFECAALKEITVPASVTRIGYGAFSSCASLTEVTLPKTLTNIGTHAFNSTPWLKTQQQKNPLVVVNGVLIDGYYCEGEVTVPEGVTAIGEGAFRDHSRITKVTMPDSVTQIGEEAFWECDALTEIHLSANLTEISAGMLYECVSLTSITIPDGVTRIRNGAFRGCSSLKEITVPASVQYIKYNAFCNCAALKSVTILNPECDIDIAMSTISNTYELLDQSKTSYTGSICGLTGSTAEEYAKEWGYTFVSRGEAPKAPQTCGEGLTWKLEDGVLTISGTGDMQDFDYTDMDRYAPWYAQRETVQKIVLEEGVTSIGNFAFRGCSALKTIKLPDGLKSVGQRAFMDCSSLYMVYMPDGMESIGGMAFENCKQLRSVRIPESLTDFGGFVFRDTLWLSKQQEESPLVIVNNIVVSGEECSGAVKIPDGVTAIADYAFYKSTGVKTVILPTSMRTIGTSAFQDCTGLSQLVIREGLTTIGSSAFMQAINLKSVTLPDSVTEIQYAAFYLCRGLETVTLPQHLTKLGDWAFSTCEALKEITLPDTLTKIPERAFWLCESLQKVTIPKTVTVIEDAAFSQCESLTEVSIPDNVQRIGADAFYNTRIPADLTIPKGTTEIGGMAFRETPWLAARQKENPLVVVNGILIDGSTCKGSVTIPSSVKMVGDGAFENCNGVVSVKIPESIPAIGERAFALCRSLKKIWFMNPKCIIPESKDTIFNHYKSVDEFDRILDGVILGYANSTAQAYAEANKYNFQAIPPIKGDYNGDFEVSMADAVLLARFAAEQQMITDEQLSRILAANPDYDGDGGITITDVTALLAAIADKQSSDSTKTKTAS